MIIGILLTRDTCSRGSAIAKIVGANVMKYNNIFETRVTMYVYEEIINNQKLTEIINTLHENIKYLPGHKLPENVASISNASISQSNIQNQYYQRRGELNLTINIS